MYSEGNVKLLAGANRAIISTWDHQDYLNGGRGYQRAVFRLKALRSTHLVHGILCEKEKGKVNLFNFNLTKWTLLKHESNQYVIFILKK